MAENANTLKTYEELRQLLDSDDELPNDYIEEQGTAAYEDDTRFDKIEFKWLSQVCEEKQNENSPIVQTDIFNEKTLNEETMKLKAGEKYLLIKSILKREDIFCLKCVEANMSDANLLWFINYLINKDIQMDHSRLKSCLVYDYTYNNNKSEVSKKSKLKKHHFDFVMKNSTL